MARTALTPAQRAANVAVAVKSLETLVKHALTMQGTHGADDARTLTAWECVRANGAVVHRQARLLAGKSRGG